MIGVSLSFSLYTCIHSTDFFECLSRSGCSDEMTFEQRPKEMRGRAMNVAGDGMFQAQETISRKALRWAHARCEEQRGDRKSRG